MRQKKVVFMRHVIAFNLIKLLPHSAEYFNKHFSLAEQGMAGDIKEPSSSYMLIVNVGRTQFGWRGILCANIALMFFCLPLSVAADYLIVNTHDFLIRAVINLACFLLMLEKYDILRLYDKRNFLKLLYAGYSLIMVSYWSITCLFLAAFENIVF